MADTEDEVRLLDDLTRLKLRLLDRKLQQPSSRYTRRERRRRSPSPEYTPTPPLPPERRKTRFHKKLDRRNEVLNKLWEELGNGGTHRTYARSLPPLSPRPSSRCVEVVPLAPALDDMLFNKKGNTKKDLMELMLIQNAQMQQWLMTQTLQRNQRMDDGGAYHYYYPNGQGGPPVRILPPIRKNDAGNQYPQDFMREEGVDFQQDYQRQPHTQLVYAADAQVTNSGTNTAAASPSKTKRGTKK